MIILISMRTVENATYAETRDAISHDWQRLLAGHGITPILVPNSLNGISAYFDVGASGLLLTGGDDLGPDDMPSLRDKTEAVLLNGAIENRMPVFGTCRGLHVINRYFGGRPERRLESHVGEHAIEVVGEGLVHVNSFHNQGVLEGGLAADLDVFAIAEGGVVEGVTHKTLPITAVQWHPERPNPAAELDRKLIHGWLKQCE
jgi:gamma-glutamyl-gamma-aminobutyrate hydrolase PuuD